MKRITGKVKRTFNWPMAYAHTHISTHTYTPTATHTYTQLTSVCLKFAVKSQSEEMHFIGKQAKCVPNVVCVAVCVRLRAQLCLCQS